MKKVKPRLSKDMLKAAGEAFAQRHRGQLLNPNASESSAACQVLEKVPPRREAAVRGSEGMSRVEEQRGGVPGSRDLCASGQREGPDPAEAEEAAEPAGEGNAPGSEGGGVPAGPRRGGG